MSDVLAKRVGWAVPYKKDRVCLQKWLDVLAKSIGCVLQKRLGELCNKGSDAPSRNVECACKKGRVHFQKGAIALEKKSNVCMQKGFLQKRLLTKRVDVLAIRVKFACKTVLCVLAKGERVGCVCKKVQGVLAKKRSGVLAKTFH
jgi:hypothetical protein